VGWYYQNRWNTNLCLL
jgi:hypothetical protein